MIGPGSVVIAIRDGGRGPDGMPETVPLTGRQYMVTETYEMPYGLGCCLKGMDPAPYRGYMLHRRSKKNPDGVWYFQEVE